LAAPDDSYAASLLSEAELALFMRLSGPEREHALAVARCVASKHPEAPATVLRAALLHDIGKLGSSANVLWRVVAHLVPAAEVPAEPRSSGLAGTRQAKRHHATYGRQLILRAGGDPEVARLVGRHHTPGSDPGASLIASCDELS
ncbi:MAG TPA: HD domain-containing protein, partial [Trueperaceae bacterium]|nr:HD domain-containing protein [Trueperaceae bacterium]